MASIILTGFMATGKSEVGRRLARALGRPFVDTDGLVDCDDSDCAADFACTGDCFDATLLGGIGADLATGCPQWPSPCVGWWCAGWIDNL